MTTIATLESTAIDVVQGVIDHEGLINGVASALGVLPEVLFAEKAFPVIIGTLRFMQQESGKSWPDVFSDLMSHLTPGQPNSPALDQTKPAT